VHNGTRGAEFRNRPRTGSSRISSSNLTRAFLNRATRLLIESLIPPARTCFSTFARAIRDSSAASSLFYVFLVCALASGEGKKRKERGGRRISRTLSFVVPFVPCISAFSISATIPSASRSAHYRRLFVRDSCSRASFLSPLRQCGTLLLRDSVHTYTCGHSPQQASRNKLKYFTRFPPGPPRRNHPPYFLALSALVSPRLLLPERKRRDSCMVERFCANSVTSGDSNAHAAFCLRVLPISLNVIFQLSSASIDNWRCSLRRSEFEIDTDEE